MRASPPNQKSLEVAPQGFSYIYEEGFHGEAIIILGHTPVQLLGKPPVPQVLADGHVILMDTGSFLSEGRISCMDLLTHEVWQSRDSEP